MANNDEVTRVAELYVDKINDWKEAKRKKGQNFDVATVVMHETDKSKKKELKLNLRSNEKDHHDRWMKALVPGVVIKAHIASFKGGPEYIKRDAKFSLISLPQDRKKDTEEVTKENVSKKMLGQRLDKISKYTFETRKYIDGIDEEVAVIREEYL